MDDSTQSNELNKLTDQSDVIHSNALTNAQIPTQEPDSEESPNDTTSQSIINKDTDLPDNTTHNLNKSGHGSINRTPEKNRSNLNKILIKIEKKKQWHDIWKLKHFILFITLAVSTIILFILSFILTDHSTLSNICIGLGTGTTTGLVLYCLNNLRNNKYARLECETSSINKIMDRIYEIRGLCYKYVSPYKTFFNTNAVISNTAQDDAERILFIFEDIRNEYRRLPLYIKDEVFNLDYDYMDDLYIKYTTEIEQLSSNVDEWMKTIFDDLNHVLDLLHTPLNEREHQLIFIKNSFF